MPSHVTHKSLANHHADLPDGGEVRMFQSLVQRQALVGQRPILELQQPVDQIQSVLP
jgi:hypothetical protein